MSSILQNKERVDVPAEPKEPEHWWGIQTFKQGAVFMNVCESHRPAAWDILASKEPYRIPGVSIDIETTDRLAHGGSPDMFEVTFVPSDVRIYEDPLFSLMIVEGDAVETKLEGKELEDRVAMLRFQLGDGAALHPTPIEDFVALKKQKAKARPN